ncbi:hypothetical protein EGR_07256 [Echinococcus granulosus]|uniref:Uncharacterized protein n=1 Tax=Echinococcus granulosus TaxID=6210 RepID=W6UWM9_ECHGR|nr:hypothetical protein EGR_07256 [Echinococcus granulosus]EUB57894.1 hypothetical protein EGR_07256 [Echinococcus granulosus]
MNRATILTCPKTPLKCLYIFYNQYESTSATGRLKKTGEWESRYPLAELLTGALLYNITQNATFCEINLLILARNHIIYELVKETL